MKKSCKQICLQRIFYLVERIGIEPMTPACKAGALPAELTPQVPYNIIEFFGSSSVNVG